MKRFFYFLLLALPLSVEATPIYETPIPYGDKILLTSDEFENKNYKLCDEKFFCKKFNAPEGKLSALGYWERKLESSILNLQNTANKKNKISYTLSPVPARIFWSPSDQLFVSLRGPLATIINIPKNTSRTEIIPNGSFAESLSPNGNMIAGLSISGSNFFYWIVRNGTLYKDQLSPSDLILNYEKLFDWHKENSLILLSDESGRNDLYKVNLSSLSNSFFSKEKIVGGNFDVVDFIVANDTLYYIANKKNSYLWSLYSYVLNTGKEELLVEDVSYGVWLGNFKNNIVFGKRTSCGTLGAMFIEKTKQYKTFSTCETNSSKKETVRESIVESEGTTGILVENPGTKNETLLVWLHGGPYRQSNTLFHPYRSYGLYDYIFRKLGEKGVTILKVNYPGSSGFGNSYAKSVYRNVGSIDVLKTNALVKKIAAEKNIKNIYLAGTSYGGYLSLKTLVETPNLYKGAFASNAVTNWLELFNQIDSPLVKLFGSKNYERIPALFDTSSIGMEISNLKNNKVVIAYGDADDNVPPAQSLSIYNKLKEKNKNVSLVKFENGGHSITSKRSVEKLCQELAKFVGIKISGKCIE